MSIIFIIIFIIKQIKQMKLTDRQSAPNVSLNDLIHVVLTGDTSQNSKGSSYKVEIGNYGEFFKFTGGTVSGTTNFTNGITTNTISATTYQNLPLDIRVTGGTYSAGTAVFTNNTGGTFSVSGFSTGGSGTDTFVSGMTFNNSTYILTLSRNDGVNLTQNLSSLVTGGTGVSYWSAGTGSNAITTLNSNNIASGNFSLAEGFQTQAIGVVSHAEGNGTQAIGSQSHAEGENTIASGQSSHAEGQGTRAFGNFSHAEGSDTEAKGDYSHAKGVQTQSNGEISYASGDSTKANGFLSFVHGQNSVVNGEFSIVLGRNITGNTANTTYVDNLNIKTLGSGNSINSLGIDASGNVVYSGNLQKEIISDYTLTNNDNNYTILVNSSNPINITIPSGLMSAINIGFIQQGTGDVTFITSGTTIRTPLTGAFKIKGQNYNAYLEQVGITNVFHLLGNLKV